MMDHTLQGKPVREVSRADIEECLQDGFAIGENDTYSADEVMFWIRLRLEVELDIRRILGETH